MFALGLSVVGLWISLTSVETMYSAPQDLTFNQDEKTGIQRLRIGAYQSFEPILIRDNSAVVGLKDAIINIDLSTGELLATSILNWNASEAQVLSCMGYMMAPCNNFVRALYSIEDHILACGTYATSPQCMFLDLHQNSLKAAKKPFSPTYAFPTAKGAGFVPYKAQSPFTYLSTKDGTHAYSGVALTSSEDRFTVARMWPDYAKPELRTLGEHVNFVASFELEDYIYFFFWESSDVVLVGQQPFSRVARICKNERGEFSSFVKATIKCDLNAELISDVFYNPDTQKFYASFVAKGGREITSPISAVCEYTLEQLNSVLSGTLLEADSRQVEMASYSSGIHAAKCQGSRTGLAVLSAQHLLPSMRVALDSNVSFTHLLVSPSPAPVLFAFTNESLYKFAIPSTPSDHGCFISKLHTGTRVNKVALVDHDQSILATTDWGLMRIPTSNCESYGRFKRSCLASADPHCGWDSRAELCVERLGRSGIERTDTACRDLAAQGTWTDWSPWEACPQEDTPRQDCLCAKRNCHMPTRGAEPCIGPDVRVTNCTLHGHWSEWTLWSACSFTCGRSAQERRRYCSNPGPKHGGRKCEGAAVEKKFCTFVPCPVATAPKVDGMWSGWTGWSECSSKCGGGIRSRRRRCDNPFPANAGRQCEGTPVEYTRCNVQSCQVVGRLTPWTPWFVSPDSRGRLTAERYQYTCSAKIDDATLLYASEPRIESQPCDTSNAVECIAIASGSRKIGDDAPSGWSKWTEWSTCDVPCGNGTQHRTRVCNGLGCAVQAKEIERRYCNMHSCGAKWSCWSDYSACSVTCGTGVRYRIRECAGDEISCFGERSMTQTCQMGPCGSEDGYAEWTTWSGCVELGAQVRIRPCLRFEMCKGAPDAQMRKCSGQTGALLSDCSTLARGLPLIAGVGGGLIVGVVITLLIVLARNRLSKSKAPQTSFFSFSTSSKQSIQHPPTPTVPKSNIYTPPPILRKGVTAEPNITLNPMLVKCEPEEVQRPEFSEFPSSFGAKGRTTYQTRDYI